MNSSSPIDLSTTCPSLLSGVGPRTLEVLKTLGIHSLQDLLFHLPLRYQDRTRIQLIAHLQPGDHALIEGEVIQAELIKARRASFWCRLKDESGIINLRFFHFNKTQLDRLKQNSLKLRCFGEVRLSRLGLEMIHPEWSILNPAQTLVLSDRLTPIYSAVKGIHQDTLRKLIKQILDGLQAGNFSLPELLPADLLNLHNLPSLIEALDYLHRPPSDVSQAELLAFRHPMQRRLALEELLAHRLALLKIRKELQAFSSTPLESKNSLTQGLITALPFELTGAQIRVINEIKNDLLNNKPMLRLVQGDVGSGKTIVAAIAMLQAAENQHQSALMAPTEILAEQHYQTLKKWFDPLGLKIGYLSSSVSRSNRQLLLDALAMGDLNFLVGTHALIQSDVKFHSLKLLIIDEQHRFGVHHRLTLKIKGEEENFYPHQLIMTATPIPRTLAMSAYADLDLSIIDELPVGRQSISTILVSNQRRIEIIERVRVNCKQGQQVYWVCTLIEESEVLQCQAAELSVTELRAAMPELKIALLHGRLKTEEKERAMAAFKAGQIDVLVATTVIEVGVDVPNASLMIIENPERLGLAQLHQLRGRVGRGALKSYCVLLYQYPLSEQAHHRLAIMRENQSGFIIAEEDLKMRGPGEVLGTRQAGVMNLKVADWVRDEDLNASINLLAPEMLLDSNRSTQIINRWLGKKIYYAGV